MLPKSQKIFQIIGTSLAWFAVILQFYLIMTNRNYSVLITLIRFFTFFTILTNILVAITFTKLLLANHLNKSFFSKPDVLTAVAVYISVVGIIYNVILRFLWEPKGLQLLVDELLHSVIPIYFITYWWVDVQKKDLKWKYIIQWMLYPFTYLVLIIICGLFTKLYPYPFIDVEKIGYLKVFINSCFMFLTFLIISFLFIGISKIARK